MTNYWSKMRWFGSLLVAMCLMLSVGIGVAQDESESQLLERARGLVQSDNFSQAIDVYSFYLRFHPRHPSALSERAVAYASLGEFDSAFSDIDSAFKSAGFSAVEQAVVHNNRGQIYFMQSELGDSLSDLSRAIDLNPDVADYWLNRGILQQVMREWDHALADYEHYLSINTADVEIYLNIARIHLAQSDTRATIDALDSAIAITPEDPELYIFRGSIHLQMEQYPQAAGDYADWLSLINNEETTHAPVEDTAELTLDMAYGQLYRIPFEAESGDRLGVAANSSAVDSLIVLIDPDGTPIMADDDSGEGLNSFFVDFSLPTDGTYTLMVGHARGGWDGEIDLTVQIVDGGGI